MKAVVMAQVTGFLPPMWNTWIEFLDPNFNLSLALAIVDIGGLNQQVGVFSACACLCQIKT